MPAVPNVTTGDTLVEAWGDAVADEVNLLRPYNVLNARGQIIRRGASAPEALTLGASGTLLQSNGTDPSWATLATALASLLTTRGQIIRRGASAPEALTLGASGTVLRSDGTDAAWATLATALASLLTTRGQIIRRGSSAPEALTLGASGTVLRSDGTDAAWSTVDFSDLTNYLSTSWTPGLAFAGNSVGMTYTVQAGLWKKLGSSGLALATFAIILSAKGSSTGAATITGLPVTVQNVNNSGGVAIASASGFSGLTGAVAGRALNNTTTAALYQWGATGMAAITDAVFGNTANFSGLIVFPIA